MFNSGTRKSTGRSHLEEVAEFVQIMMNYHFSRSKIHFNHVRTYTKMLCLRYNMLYPHKAIPESELPLIFEAAALHDIGLISIPNTLFDKKGELTDAEREQFRQHTVIGAKIVGRLSGIDRLTAREEEILHNITLYHHERYDGSGYPEGLKGDQIPLEAQIVSLAEVYDGMSSSNYTEAHTHEETMQAIMNGECGAFNPELLVCLENTSLDMQALLECSDNEERKNLLQNTYGRSRKGYWKRKRAMDLIVASLGLLVASPFMLLIALMIFLDDPHASPIFCQTRVGRHRKEFTMYKFRTMYKDAEQRKKELEALNEKDGPVFKIEKDPRITRVGRLLRKTGLDELPQLVNVLKGDMTLVGPRPPLPSEVEQYSRYTEMRLSVTPGLTCIWQVQPRRDDISFDKWMDMDIAYIGTRSLWEDIKLLFRTFMSVFHGSGS